MSVATASSRQHLQFGEKTTLSWEEPSSLPAQVTRRVDSPVDSKEEDVPDHQKVALLHAARQPFVLTEGYPTPLPKSDDELVIKVKAIGLNPVDWKSV